ncbi:hypothetical protein J1605_015680 [Eschrichtius robustus]|uniref:Uncharacterized protein n=1 Tax=Eschrichtius robustus TaxID=9764 RepID=A0AB34GAK1_ESCRO|nr:hypothetical protein J1605_015680 [Eschrichtius robustus]
MIQAPDVSRAEEAETGWKDPKGPGVIFPSLSFLFPNLWYWAHVRVPRASRSLRQPCPRPPGSFPGPAPRTPRTTQRRRTDTPSRQSGLPVPPPPCVRGRSHEGRGLRRGGVGGAGPSLAYKSDGDAARSAPLGGGGLGGGVRGGGNGGGGGGAVPRAVRAAGSGLRVSGGGTKAPAGARPR